MLEEEFKYLVKHVTFMAPNLTNSRPITYIFPRVLRNAAVAIPEGNSNNFSFMNLSRPKSLSWLSYCGLFDTISALRIGPLHLKGPLWTELLFQGSFVCPRLETLPNLVFGHKFLCGVLCLSLKLLKEFMRNG